MASGNNSEKAALYYKAVLDVDPEHYFANMGLGAIKGFQKDFNGSLKHFRACLRQKPEDADLPFNIGATFAKMGNFGEALNYFSRSLNLAPDAPHVQKALKQTRLMLDGK